MTNETTMINIDAIVMDETTQCRNSLNAEAIDDYAECMAAGDKFPPVDLFGKTEKCWLGDGWHRIEAARKTGQTSILAVLHPGGRTEAVKHALGANRGHALRRSNADKRKAVEVALKEFPAWSNRQIADECRVSEGLVRKIEAKVRTVRTSTKRVGKDGKSYPASPTRSKKEEPAGVVDKDAGTPADSPDEQAAPVSPKQPVASEPASVNVKAVESPDVHVVESAKGDNASASPDVATLHECRAVYERTRTENVADVVRKLRELMKDWIGEEDLQPEPFPDIVAIIGEYPEDSDVAHNSDLLNRALRAFWKSNVNVYDDDYVKEVFFLIRDTVVIKLPLFETLDEKFSTLISDATQDPIAKDIKAA